MEETHITYLVVKSLMTPVVVLYCLASAKIAAMSLKPLSVSIVAQRRVQLLTYSRVEIWDEGGQCNDKQQEVLPTIAPILRVQQRVRGLRPEYFGPIAREFELGCHSIAKLNPCCPDIDM